MKKVMFKLITLTVCLCSCVICASALGTLEIQKIESLKYDNFYYEIQEDNTVTITGGEYNMLSDDTPFSIDIPSFIDGYPVTAISDMAFFVNYPLDSVTLPEGLVSIGNSAFVGCAISEITFPSTLTTIGGSAFAGCPISNVYIPASVTTLGSGAFSNSSLINITYVGHDNIWVENHCMIVDGVLESYMGNDPHVVIPTGVTSIGDYAFSSNKTLASVSIPNTVTSIEKGAFYYCPALTTVTIPSSVEYIGISAFSDCYALTTVIIEEGVSELAARAFQNCYALSSISIPQSITSIGEANFSTCKSLTDVYFGGTISQWNKVNPNDQAMNSFDSLSGSHSVSPTIHYNSVIPTTTTTTVTTPTVEETVNTAVATASSVYVDGVITAFDAYTINENNYFKLRDIAQILSGTEVQFEVTWDGDKQAINLVSGESYTSVGGELATGDGTAKSYTANTSTIYLNGEEVSLTAYTINDNNYFKLRDLGEALGFNVSWDSDAQSIVIASDEAYTAD